MRRLLCTLIQALMLVTLAVITQQSLAESDPFWNINRYEWFAQTVTHAGRVRVTITKTKPKLYLARSQQLVARLLTDDQNDDYYDDLTDFQVGYRRPELVDQTADIHTDISDEIKIRLVLARMKALARYQETWG